MKQLALGVRLRAGAVYASFAPGPNAEIVTALRAPGIAPMWLWGGAGSGKTHLLQAACSEAGAAAAYFPLHRTAKLPPDALSGFERNRLLCIDDVDQIAGDAAWERALFGLFNEAAELHTRLIFAAAVAPRRPSWVLGDWRSRAAACIVYQLRELDDDGRIEALRLRAAQRGLQLPRETAEYLLKRMPRDLPSLFDILDALDEASLVEQRRLTVPFIRDELEKHAGTKS
ncbi:MAG TPA: DnaA regulatory inactivator Hda [Steroidobacteraceae bacterium]|jgi:DnaA family protein|nr:DnaA regulatory inactivator Hda [Steroidobacteraceae bacterium]